MHPLIEKARAKLVIRNAFFSSVLLSTELKEDDTLQFVGATNGDTIIVNPKKILEMSKNVEKDTLDYAIFMMVHEVGHIIFMHPFRRGGRDAMVVDSTGQVVTAWNIACDAVVNEILAKEGFVVPPGVVRWPGAEEMSAEEVYDKLLKDLKKNPNKQVAWQSMDDCQDNQGDGKEDGEGQSGNSPSDVASKEMQVKIKVQRALDIAKACGNVPASLQRFVEAAMESKIPWQKLLREYLTTITKKEDFTWSRMNRRYVWNNVYLPSMFGQQCGPIFVAFDTSGSVGSAELAAFLGEMNAIFEEVHPEKIMAGFCDCQFYGPHTDIMPEDLPMDSHSFSKITRGGGGTAFKPVFDYLKEKDIVPQVLIYLTDLEGSDFGDEPVNYPVLWVSTSSEKAPWGQVIKLDL